MGYSPWGRKESDTTDWLHFTTEIESEMKTAREEEMNKGTKEKKNPIRKQLTKT